MGKVENDVEIITHDYFSERGTRSSVRTPVTGAANANEKSHCRSCNYV